MYGLTDTTPENFATLARCDSAVVQRSLEPCSGIIQAHQIGLDFKCQLLTRKNQTTQSFMLIFHKSNNKKLLNLVTQQSFQVSDKFHIHVRDISEFEH